MRKTHIFAGAALAALLLGGGAFMMLSAKPTLYTGWDLPPSTDVNWSDDEIRMTLNLSAAIKDGDAATALSQLANFRNAAARIVGEDAQKYGDPRALRVALQYAASAAALQPEDPAHWTTLGQLYQLTSSYDPIEATEAPVMFARALERDPDFAPALLSAGQWYFERMQYDRALPYLEKLAQIDPRQLSDSTFLSALTINYILVGRADIGAEILSALPNQGEKHQQAIVLLKRESSSHSASLMTGQGDEYIDLMLEMHGDAPKK